MRRMGMVLVMVGVAGAAELVAGPDSQLVSEPMRLLKEGRQIAAEQLLDQLARHSPESCQVQFLRAICERSRWCVEEASRDFVGLIDRCPDTSEGHAAACVLGIDEARGAAGAIYYYDSLLMLGRSNPDSIPIHWLIGMMSRAITERFRSQMPQSMWLAMVDRGIAEYEAVQTLFGGGQGPVLLHQTMANLLDERECYDEALRHRQTAAQLDQSPWCLDAEVSTLQALERPGDALPVIMSLLKNDSGDRLDFQKLVWKKKIYERLCRYFPKGWPPAWKRALHVQGTDGASCLKLGNIYWDLGRQKDAMDAYRTATQLEPKEASFFRVLADRYTRLGDYASARESSRRSLVLDPRDVRQKIRDARLAVHLQEPGSSEYLLKAGTFDYKGNPQTFDAQKDPWIKAITLGDIKEFEKLVGKSDVNASCGKLGKTPLMIAAESGWEPIVRGLLKAGAHVNLVDTNGDSALHYSVDFGQPHITKILLDAGADKDLVDKWKQTPLFMSISQNETECFQSVMEKGPRLDDRAGGREPALHSAVGWGRLGMVKTLLSNGANVNAIAQWSGRTPVFNMVEYGHAFLLPVLMDAGADLRCRDKAGRTILHSAILDVPNPVLIRALLAHGADPTVKDQRGHSPIALAREAGYEELARSMEKAAGKEEPDRFPEISFTSKDISGDGKAADLFALPEMLLRGRLSEDLLAGQWGKKSSAINDLDFYYFIKSYQQLQWRLHGLMEGMLPYQRGHGAQSHGGVPAAVQNLVWQIQEEEGLGGRDDTAWNMCHVIGLAKLGALAGMMTDEVAARWIRLASERIVGRFSGWSDYLENFMMSAKVYDGLEVGRCRSVCRRLESAKLPWPETSREAGEARP